jgi:hypothetical protein
VFEIWDGEGVELDVNDDGGEGHRCWQEESKEGGAHDGAATVAMVEMGAGRRVMGKRGGDVQRHADVRWRRDE